MPRLLLLVSVAFLVGAGEATSDADKFQGTWRLLVYHNDGSELPKAKLEKMTVLIKGDTMIIGTGTEEEKYTFKLDPKKTPRAINLSPTEGKKLEFLGIYELKEDTLRIGLHLKGERPTEFPTKKRDCALLVLKREKK